MDTTVAPIGVDIGKEVFHLVGFGADGKIAFRRKIKRLALIEMFRKLPPCIVGMAACLSGPFVSRALRQLGHEPRIIPAIYVKPFVKGQKNDYNDAEAIAEAALRPNLRTVREKSRERSTCRRAIASASSAPDRSRADRCCCKTVSARSDPLKIEEPVDAPQQVIGGDVCIEPELGEQLHRFGLNPHHRRVPSANPGTDTPTDQPPTRSTQSADRWPRPWFRSSLGCRGR